MEEQTSLIIILTILSVVFLLFAGFSIPFLLQIWRTARSMAQTLELLNEGLPSIMKNMGEITTNINQTTTIIQQQVLEFTLTMQNIQGMIRLVVSLEEVLRSRIRLPFVGAVRTSAAVIRGVRAFLNLLLDDRREGRRGPLRLP